MARAIATRWSRRWQGWPGKGCCRCSTEGKSLTDGPILEGILRAGLDESLPLFARAGLLLS